MGNTLIYTVIVAAFLFFFLTGFIVVIAVFQNKKKQFFKQELLRSQLEIQEQTFNIISQEIHDNVGQILSLAKVQLNIIEESERKEPSLLNDAKENISKAMTDLRDIAKGLNSERIQLVGILSAVEQEIQRINRTAIVNISLEVTGIEKKIDNQKQLILFRVIQEGLQNIIKHASASAVHVIFNYTSEELMLSLTDNGKGFDLLREQKAHHGLGLQNIIKRINLIGGKAEINSVLTEGTSLKLTIPYV